MFGHFYFGANYFGDHYFGAAEPAGVHQFAPGMTASVGSVRVTGVGIRPIGAIGQAGVANGANSGTVSSTITVPAGTKMIVVTVSSNVAVSTPGYFDSMTFTKGGVDTPMVKIPSGDLTPNLAGWAAGMFYLLDPDIGTNKTLKYDWLGTDVSLAVHDFSWTFWNNVAPVDPVRDSGYSQAHGGPLITPTLNCHDGDVVICFCALYTPYNDNSGGVTSWLNVDDMGDVPNYNYADAAWAYREQTGPVQVGTLTRVYDSDWASVVAAAFRMLGSIDVPVTGQSITCSMGSVSIYSEYGVPAYVTGVPGMTSTAGEVTFAGNVLVDVVQVGTIGHQPGTDGRAQTGTITGITVPAGAQMIMVGVSGFNGANHGFDAMTFTKGGVDTAMIKADGGDLNTCWQGALFYQINPDVGTNMTLKWSWLTPINPAGAMNISWTFWKGMDPVRPLRDATATQSLSFPITTRTMDVRVTANDAFVAFCAHTTNGDPGSIDSWSGVEEIGEPPGAVYALGAWAGERVAQFPVPIAALTTTNSYLGSLIAVTLRSISAQGEVFVDSQLLTSGVGTVVATGIDNRTSDAWDVSTTSPLGCLSNSSKTLNSTPGPTLYVAKSTQVRGPSRVHDLSYYAEVTISGAPNGYVGLYNEASDTGLLLQLETGRIIQRPDGTVMGSLPSPVHTGDVIGIAYRLDSGKAWIRANHGYWNGSPTATPEGYDWVDEVTTGSRGPYLRVPEDVSRGKGWFYRNDGIIQSTDPDALLENLHIRCFTWLTAANAVVRNCLIQPPAEAAFQLLVSGPNALLEYCSFFGEGGFGNAGPTWATNGQKGLVLEPGSDGSIVRYCHVQGTGDGFSVSSPNCLLEYNYYHNPCTSMDPDNPTEEPHTDGMQIYGPNMSDGLTVRHNRIDGYTPFVDFNSCWIIGAISNDMTFEHNWCRYGAFPCYIAWRPSITVTNNRILRGAFGYLTFVGDPVGMPFFSGNYKEEDGSPLFPPWDFYNVPNTPTPIASPPGLTVSIGFVSVGIPTATSVSATGNSMTASVGSVAASTAIHVSATGNAVTASVGTVSITTRRDAMFTVTGNGVTASAGTVVVPQTISFGVTGTSAAVSVGSVFVTAVSVNATGNGITASVGTVSVTTTRTEYAFITTNLMTASVGTTSVTVTVSVSVTGNSAAASVGTVTQTSPRTTSVTGNSVAVSAGTTSVTTTRTASTVLTGPAMTASAGTATVTAKRTVSVSVTGPPRLTFGLGTVTVSIGGAGSTWPDATNTGASGTLIAVPGSATSGATWTWDSVDKIVQPTAAGVTIANLDVTGTIYNEGLSNVTVSNCITRYVPGAITGIYGNNAANMTVQDCTVIGPTPAQYTAGFSTITSDHSNGFHVQRCNISGGENGMFISGTNQIIEDNYIHDLVPEDVFGDPNAPTAPHTDGCQMASTECSGIIVRHNNIISCVTYATSCIIMGPGTNMTVTNNRLRNANVSLYVWMDSTCVYTNNRIAGWFGAAIMDTGGTGAPTITGNVNDDTGVPINYP